MNRDTLATNVRAHGCQPPCWSDRLLSLRPKFKDRRQRDRAGSFFLGAAQLHQTRLQRHMLCSLHSVYTDQLLFPEAAQPQRLKFMRCINISFVQMKNDGSICLRPYLSAMFRSGFERGLEQRCTLQIKTHTDRNTHTPPGAVVGYIIVRGNMLL